MCRKSVKYVESYTLKKNRVNTMEPPSPHKSKILLYDIETAPIIGTAWRKHDTDLVWIVKDWHLLTIAYKWLGDRSCHVIGLDDFKLYKKDPTNDYEVTKRLHELFDEADIILAHNGDRFDRRKANARFLFHSLTPPSPYQTIDTLKVARKQFDLSSNRLDDLGNYLGVGRKIHTDKDLWRNCMAGDTRAWKKMKAYNKQDVLLLERVYKKLLSWAEGHPNLSNLEARPEACPRCGSGPIQSRGLYYSKTATYQRYSCRNCHSWFRGRGIESDRPKPRYV